MPKAMRHRWIIMDPPRIHSALVFLVSTLLIIPWSDNNAYAVAASFNYAVQVKPVIFLQEPVSKLIKVGDALTQSCQARVAQLVNRNQPLPTLRWLKDKIPITTSMIGITITTNSTYGLTELVVQQANTSWAGSYECEARDGQDTYVTVSRRATVFVVSKDAVHIKANIGQPLFLPCSPSPNHVTSWTHNGQPVNQSYLLSDGSLYVSKIDLNHHGTWQCYNTYNITTSFTVEKNDSLSKPEAVIDRDIAKYQTSENTSTCVTSNSNISIGCTVYLFCNITGISEEHIGHGSISVTWYLQRNDTTVIHQESCDELASDMTFHYIVDSFDISDGGRYSCLFNLTVQNSVVIVDSQELTLSVEDNMPTNDIAQDIFLPFDGSDSISLNCGNNIFPFTSFYWTRNGKVINSTLYTDNTNLIVNKETFHDVFAVYQCFIEGPNDIIRYSIHRILVKYLCNPPGNFKITAHTNTSNYFLPYLHLTWVPPIHRGGLDAIAYSIFIYVFGSTNTPYTVEISPSHYTNSTTVELPNDAVYYVALSIVRPNVEGIPTSCSINTRERFTRVNKPFDQLKCTDDGHVLMQWTPVGIQPNLYPTEDMNIKGNCVYNGEIIKFQMHVNFLYEEFKKKLDGLLPGTICEFYGNYRYVLLPPSVCDSDVGGSFGSTYFTIPRETCQVQEETPTAVGNYHADQGGGDSVILMVCGSNKLEIKWSASQEVLCGVASNNSNIDNMTTPLFQLYVFGVCVLEDEQLMFNHSVDLIANPFGSVTFDNMPTQSICSIYTNSTSSIGLQETVISPAQCVMGSSVSSEYNIFNQTVNCSRKHLPANQSSSSLELFSSSLVHVVTESPTTPVTQEEAANITEEPDKNILITIVAVVCLIVFVIAIAFVTVSIIIALRRHKGLKRSWSMHEVYSKNDPQSDDIVFNDACSIKTELEGFRTESTELNELNVYEGYTIEDKPSRPDTTGSSGYGSEITTQSTIDYHCKKLKEVSEDADNCTCDSNSSTCIDSLSDTDELELTVRPASLYSCSTRQNFILDESKEGFVMCAVCKRVHCVKTGSLTRLCPCMMRGGQEYIRLNKELHASGTCCCSEESKDWLTTNRLSAFSV